VEQALHVRWPSHYEPANCPVHVRNELAIAAPADTVWAWLVRAQLWPTWYVNSSNLRFLDGAPPDLGHRTRFQWRTFGVTIESTVLEFVPGERIAWDAHASGIDAYHAWVIQRTAEGCHVLTEETQHGWLARLGKVLMPRRMWDLHQTWLEGLKANAAKGLPPNA
jgi:uncharacterized protein YndB with AHSA1/START domain